MNSNMVKPEKFGHLHLVDHFTVPSVAMFERWRMHLGKEGKYSALFIDLYKTFDSLQHDLLLAKLNAYGFSYKSIKLISIFLSGREYRTKIDSAYSDWEDLLIGVPQGSGLGQ